MNEPKCKNGGDWRDCPLSNCQSKMACCASPTSRNGKLSTPRTDAARHNMGSVTEPHYVVDEEVARQLERELAQAHAAVREANSPHAREKRLALIEEIERLKQSHGPSNEGWKIVPSDEPLGAFLTGQPGKVIYAIDERGVPLNTPFRVWRMQLPELPSFDATPNVQSGDVRDE